MKSWQTLKTRHVLPATIAAIVLAVAIYVGGVPGNPPGFYLDESSVAYNAETSGARLLRMHFSQISTAQGSSPQTCRPAGKHKSCFRLPRRQLENTFWR